jgi:hypothetical protein
LDKPRFARHCLNPSGGLHFPDGVGAGGEAGEDVIARRRS